LNTIDNMLKTYPILLKGVFTMNFGQCGYSYHLDGYEDHRKGGFDRFLIRLQVEGSAEATILNKKYSLKKGDIILVPANHNYRLQIKPNVNSGDFHLFSASKWINQWWDNLNKPFRVKISNIEQVTTIWNYLATELRRPNTEQNHELVEHLFKSICLFIQQETVARFSQNRPFVVTEMMRYIEEHALESFMVEDVANSVDLSVSRSVHLFKEYTGKTMIEYAQHIRLTSALNQMKYTNLTLNHIAENCGFGNYPYFHRVFKKAYGKPPGEYRRML